MLHEPSFFGDLSEAMRFDWPSTARAEQLPPPGNWSTWLILAGRGFGKTRTGAEWVRAMVCGPTPLARGRYGRVALVAETAADARDVMVGDGVAPGAGSGIMQVHPKDFRPIYEPSKRRLTWPNGATATLFNAVEPDQLRGPEHDAAWVDEVAKWRYAQETWDMLQMGLRVGKQPRVVATTTPRPIKLLKTIMEDPGTVVTRGRTLDNAANLSAAFLATIKRRYEGTRLGRQEIEGELLSDTPGALWTREMIEERRRKPDEVPTLVRVVVAIDPAATSGEEADETGIITAGIDEAGHVYVLDDLSGQLAPVEWARRAIAEYRSRRADRIVAEVNQGGEMVEQTLRTVDPNAAYKGVHASRGKATRAEPVSALYEQGRVHHVGYFAQLEDQMCAFVPGLKTGGGSPDRMDALVWAITDLAVESGAGFGLIEFYRQEAGKVQPGDAGAGPWANEPSPATVRLRAPEGISTVVLMSGRSVHVGADQTVSMSEEDAKPLIAAGWTRIEVEEVAE